MVIQTYWYNRATHACFCHCAQVKPFPPLLPLKTGQPPKKQVLSTTVPKEFNFLSDARVKGSTSAADTTYAVCDFTAQLRKHPSSPVNTFLVRLSNICYFLVRLSNICLSIAVKTVMITQ